MRCIDGYGFSWHTHCERSKCREQKLFHWFLCSLFGRRTRRARMRDGSTVVYALGDLLTGAPLPAAEAEQAEQAGDARADDRTGHSTSGERRDGSLRCHLVRPRWKINCPVFQVCRAWVTTAGTDNSQLGGRHLLIFWTRLAAMSPPQPPRTFRDQTGVAT